MSNQTQLWSGVNRLKYIRLAKGISQKEVSITLGVTQATVSSWERGTKSPSMNNMKRLAKIYEVSLDYLVGSTDSIDPASSPTVPDGNDEKSLAERDEAFTYAMKIVQLPEDAKQVVLNMLELLEGQQENKL